MSRLLPSGISIRIALASLLVALVAVTIVGFGVWFVGGQAFAELMAQHGESAAAAHEMFDAAVTRILLLAIAVAVAAAAALAFLLGMRLGRPLRDVGRAARRIAAGNFAARLPRRGSEELLSVADSFNLMAASLERQEGERRAFIANAAHELRTPLTNLQGYLEALRDAVIPPERQVFESLWEEADRLVRLSQSLDQLARGEHGDLPARVVELDLPTAIGAAVELCRPAAKANQLEVELSGPPRLAVRGDPDRLSQVLANLLNNAIRYTPRDGRVRVEWEARRDHVMISVANTGDGIPAADLPHIFDRFYRVEKSRDRTRGGAGIGLAIVRQLVESAGGTVGAESTTGLTRIWFTLPAVTPAVSPLPRLP